MSRFARRRRPDAVEADADRLAARALSATSRGPSVAPARTQAHTIPAGVPAGPSPPLEPHVRADMERSFAHDFSQVRVHASGELSRTAERLGSRAFALGSHIAFAPAEYSPHTAGGRALIAHELAHVVQVDRGSVAPRLMSQKAAGKKVFYQEVLDAFNQTWGKKFLALKPFVAFCEAIDQEKPADLPKLMDAVEKADIYTYPPDVPKTETAITILATLTMLAQPAVATRFRTWFAKFASVSAGFRHGRRYFDDEIWLWETTLRDLAGRVDWKDADKSLRLLDALLIFFRQVVAERNTLDRKKIAEDAERLKDAGGLTDSRFGMESHPLVSIARYDARLGRVARETFRIAQFPYQAALERAIDDLTAGKGAARLEDVKKRITNVLGVMAPVVTGTGIEINETVYVKEGRKDVLRQVDYFLEGKAALKRSVKLTSYDETTDTVFPRPWQTLDAHRIVAIRTNQIAALERIYGLEKDPTTKKTTAEAQENKQALGALGAKGLRLHNDDDWRAFLEAKFDKHFAVSKSAEESLHSVIELLRVYLRAFTVHSPMNIDDLGDNLLTVTFPRALTGQLVHDCGVYALRIVYMLSLIRDHPALKLRIRFIQLPVHVGLIITGDNLPAYLVHNDSFVKYDQADLQTYRAKWDKLDEKGQPRAAAAPHTAANDERFMAELAGMEFIPNTDVPFKVTEVPKLTGTAPASDKATLWRSYQRLVVGSELFGPVTFDPKDPAYQFHLRYLEALEAIKVHHNTFVVPFWNEIGHTAWVATVPRLRAAERAIANAKTPDEKKKAQAAFDVQARAYLVEKPARLPISVTAAFQKVLSAFSPITAKTSAIVHELETRPKIVAPRVQRTSGDRLMEMFGQFAHPYWTRATLEHIADIRMRTLTPPAPYAERKDLLNPID